MALTTSYHAAQSLNPVFKCTYACILHLFEKTGLFFLFSLDVKLFGVCINPIWQPGSLVSKETLPANTSTLDISGPNKTLIKYLDWLLGNYTAEMTYYKLIETLM